MKPRRTELLTIFVRINVDLKLSSMCLVRFEIFMKELRNTKNSSVISRSRRVRNYFEDL